MVTTGGWAYCLQLQALARREHYTLACGRYWKDGYVGYGLRAKRHLDWGDPAYLATSHARSPALHRTVGGQLDPDRRLLLGLRRRHPRLPPPRAQTDAADRDRLLPRSRRPPHALPPTHPTAREIDAETGGSAARRSGYARVTVQGLAQLVRAGTSLTVIWSISTSERVEFGGATCDRTANAATLAALAPTLDRPVPPGSPTAGTATTSGIAAAPSSPATRPDTKSASHPTARSPPARPALRTTGQEAIFSQRAGRPEDVVGRTPRNARRCICGKGRLGVRSRTE